ncbi:MAG: tRNA 2-thiouridine(34) synthase MnmA [Candidatus Magasanikbacteria bacterium]
MRKISKDNKILVAMSGGVDSSVTAALLKDQGYDVTGAYMVNFDSTDNDIYDEDDLDLECWRGDYRDAVRVAAHLDIELLRFDFKEEYRDFVLDYMFEEYKAGRTPNPDVLCNKSVKFGAWLKEARDRGFDKLATGHYARIEKRDDDYHLMQAEDKDKDQTYFLHQLSQDQIKDAVFPLGEYKKEKVRELAEEYELPTADREESMGICFVGEVPMDEFLKNKIEEDPGPIVQDETGEQIGEHDGLMFFTIGQRRGIDQEGGDKPRYVIEKDFENNKLIVGYEDNPKLYTKQARLEKLNWISGQKPVSPLTCKARIRHRQELQNCEVKEEEDGEIIVEFEEKQRAVTPGQFCVFYKGQECLGGGVVSERK